MVQDAGSMAGTMLDAAVEFAESKPQFVTSVRIIVFSGTPEMLTTFNKEIKKRASSGNKKSLWCSLTGTLTRFDCLYSKTLFYLMKDIFPVLI